MGSCTPWHPGLLQAIEHQSICSEQRAVATLLCTSKQLSTAVKQACKGLVPVRCRLNSLQEAKWFAEWISTYGCIVKGLDIGPYQPKWQIGARRDEATKILASALSTALSSPPRSLQGIYLQHVVLDEVANEPLLIRQLSRCSQLTSLEILLPRFGRHLPVTAATGACMAPAHLGPELKGLQSLRSLVLHSRWHPHEANTDELILALRYLTNLTLLSMKEPYSQTALQHLPPQLQHLQLLPRDDNPPARHTRPQQQMNLSHLTALTAISYCKSLAAVRGSGSYVGAARCVESLQSSFAEFADPPAARLDVYEGHYLPPSLQQLTLGRVFNVGALQQLTRLQHLHITNPNQQADVLMQLAQHCKQLTSVQLHYFHQSGSEMKHAAIAWRSLPLTALDVDSCRLDSWSFEQLAQVTSLTRLQLRISYEQILRLPLATAIRQLKGLQKLEIRESSSDIFGHDIELDLEAMGIAEELQNASPHLFEVPAGVQQLRCFAYSGYSRKGELCALEAATQLTALRLQADHLEDRNLSRLTGRLAKLKELNLSGSIMLTSRCLSAISSNLPQLTYLDLCQTGINQVAVCQLSHISVLRMGPSVLDEPSYSFDPCDMDLGP